MHQIHTGHITLFPSYFKHNKEIHWYGTRQINQCYVPSAKIELGKSALHFHGDFIWNNILKLPMGPVMTENVFSKYLKDYLLQNMM